MFFQTRLPCDPSSLTRWRRRLGEAGIEELLAQTIAAARSMMAITVGDMKRVIVDTTAHTIACAASYNIHWLLRWIALLRAWWMGALQRVLALRVPQPSQMTIRNLIL